MIEACIRRIKDVNSALNCFVEDRFELALKEAREADDLVRSGLKSPTQLEEEKPFLGVPFTTKDCIGVKGTMRAIMEKLNGLLARVNNGLPHIN